MHDGISSPSISPEGSEDTLDSKFKKQNSIYDLSGRKIMEQGGRSKGVFVKQNKKVILK